MNELKTYDLYSVLAAEAFGVPLEKIEVGDARWSWARINASTQLGTSLTALEPPRTRLSLQAERRR
jgi:hypothetical protein